MNKVNLLFLAFIAICSAFAQVNDSLLLAEVTVVESKLLRLRQSQYALQNDSLARVGLTFESAAKWLQNESSSHIRQYAPGMVASYSTHGATSAQNAVLWAGIPINSAATGLTDLSLVPIQLLDPTMVRGGNAALFGSAAMGSVFNLQPNLSQKPFLINVMGQWGSFQTQNSSIQLGFRAKNLNSLTSFSRSSSQNNYTFQNPYLFAKRIDTLTNAAYQITQIMQNTKFLLGKTQWIDADVWLTMADRESPQNILMQSHGHAKLVDKTSRIKLGWHRLKNNMQLDVNYAFLDEWQRYTDRDIIDANNQSTDDTNKTLSHVAQIDFQKKWGEKWVWQGGAIHRFDRVGGSNRVGQQQTSAAQTSLSLHAGAWKVLAALRAEAWQGKLLPISPYVSVSAKVLKHLSFHFFGGYNYRVPSMNDRFWQPGGNPNLLPESGWSYESSVVFQRLFGKISLKSRAAFYQATYTNLIQWVPIGGGIWQTENVKNVAVSGFDFSLSTDYTRHNLAVAYTANLSLNSSQIRQSHTANDQSLGKQLVYQPKFKFTQRLQLGFKNWFTQIAYNFTGVVSSSYAASNNTLPGFGILNAKFGYTIQAKSARYLLLLGLNNIFDTYYETIAYFPMPGKNIALTLKLEI